jgi:CubicO group peptidase (beta-lactamase class C family)
VGLGDAVDGDEASDRQGESVMQGFPPPPESRIRADQVYSRPAATRWFMHHVREVEPTANIATRHGDVTQLPEEPTDLDDAEVVDAGGDSWTVAEMLAETSTDGILVLRGGKAVYERCFGSLTATRPHLCHSITKSIASCVAANLIEHGVMAAEDLVVRYVPELADSAYRDARVRHLLDMTVGIRYTEDHEDDESEDARLDRLCGVKPSREPDEPGSAYDFATETVRQGEHGVVLHYVSLNTDVLGWVMERATGVPVQELIAREVWSKLGAEDDAYIALDGAGSAQLDGGFCCSLRDLARFGLMLVDHGALAGRQVVPASWIDDICANGDQVAFAAAPDCRDLPHGWSYRSCLWVGEPAQQQAFMGLGMYGQMLYVSPAAGVVVAKFSSQRRPADDVLVTRTYRALQALTALVSGP